LNETEQQSEALNETEQQSEALDETENQFPPMYDGRFKKDFIKIKVLGKGGFGQVFKVEHKFEKTLYAIKRIKFKGF
jgi:translation initiation factor 2-alpha kinase 3